MRRRQFITLVGGTAVAWPFAGYAQQSAMPVIGFLRSNAPEDTPELLTAFREGLKDTGFAEGQNVIIEYRFANNQNERLPTLAADLVRRQVAVIFAPATPVALAAKAATKIIPIVFEVGADPWNCCMSLSRTQRQWRFSSIRPNPPSRNPQRRRRGRLPALEGWSSMS